MPTAERTYPAPPPIAAEHGPSAAEWGMLAFLLSEVALFSTLLVSYVAFMGQDTVGPTPSEALKLPLVVGMTVCLLASSVVIHAAEGMLERGRQALFCLLWTVTIALGVAFLAGTAFEWHALIFEEGLTISRNMFGTTFYTLIGFHGLHVTAGVTAMSIVLLLAVRRQVSQANATGVKLIAWYWHFVDVVWIVVFLLVYVASARGGT